MAEQATSTAKVGGDPLKIPLGEGYHVEFQDYGIAGVLVRLFRPDWQSGDKEAAAMIPKRQSDELLYWLERTVGRDAMALPIQTLGVLKGLLARDGIEKLLPKADWNVLTDTIQILEDINSLGASNFNTESRVQRALSR